MSNERVIFENPDKTVSILMPGKNYMETHTINDVIAKDIPAGITRIVKTTADNITQDRLFRPAWKFTSDTDDNLTIDMPKARTIHMERIRRKRNEELVKLDSEQLRHADNPTELQKVKTEKQRLRNIPQTFDLSSAATPEQLKNLWPSKLTKAEEYEVDSKSIRRR